MGDIQQIDKNGKILMIEGRWTLVRDETGKPESILAINTDITEKKKLEQQFLRAQRMESIGTLAGGIAHDLNNVLTPILMCVDILKMSRTEKQKEEMLDTIGKSARRGAEMISQVLSFARGVEGKQIKIQALHLIKDIEKIAQDTFPKNIRIESTISPDLWTIIGDPTQLHQILLNLCVNARDAMPEGGKLMIDAENIELDAQYAAMNIEAKAGPHVCIGIEDTGTGISQDIIDKIFDPFFTTKALGHGTGLGLSTSLAIVKSHGGFMRVYSEAGKGARFSIYLPAQTEASGPDLENTIAEFPRGRGETILVVDDEPSIRQVTGQTLEAFGYRVITATDGAEAVATYATHRAEIAAVLMDMMMPIMDGPSAIQVLMKMNPEVKIIAVSGISLNGGIAKVVGGGVKDFLPKPYTSEGLLQALKRILNDSPR
jgi:signal transduction histidine kinase/CheY-like chemotaxis protein